MNKIVIGKYVTTHGIKGEIRIKSDFNEKDKVFKVGNEIIIDSVNAPSKRFGNNVNISILINLPHPLHK